MTVCILYKAESVMCRTGHDMTQGKWLSCSIEQWNMSLCLIPLEYTPLTYMSALGHWLPDVMEYRMHISYLGTYSFVYMICLQWMSTCSFLYVICLQWMSSSAMYVFVALKFVIDIVYFVCVCVYFMQCAKWAAEECAVSESISTGTSHKVCRHITESRCHHLLLRVYMKWGILFSEVS